MVTMNIVVVVVVVVSSFVLHVFKHGCKGHDYSQLLYLLLLSLNQQYTADWFLSASGWWSVSGV